MPAELIYYLVWYGLSRSLLGYTIRRRMARNARRGVPGLGQDSDLLLGFAPVIAEVLLCLLCAVIILEFAIGAALEGVVACARRYGSP